VTLAAKSAVSAQAVNLRKGSAMVKPVSGVGGDRPVRGHVAEAGNYRRQRVGEGVQARILQMQTHDASAVIRDGAGLWVFAV
jgi:ribosomal protein S8E